MQRQFCFKNRNEPSELSDIGANRYRSASRGRSSDAVCRKFGISSYALAIGIFLAAAFTGILDGHLARRRNQVSNFGKLLDPIADKLLVSAALIILVEKHRAPAWAVVT